MRIRNKPVAAVLILYLMALPVTRADIPTVKPTVTVDQLFDRYGRINWEFEMARLDNFTIQLQNDPDSIGYIFVHDANEMCAGEAQARALRAKRYVVERRGIPWNRVIWRIDGYDDSFTIILEPLSRSIPIPYPFVGSIMHSPKRYVGRQCRTRIAEIQKPNL